MPNLARKIPPRLTSHLYDGCDEVDGRLCPPANEEQMLERLGRAARFMAHNPVPLAASYEDPDVSGGE